MNDGTHGDRAVPSQRRRRAASHDGSSRASGAAAHPDASSPGVSGAEDSRSANDGSRRSDRDRRSDSDGRSDSDQESLGKAVALRLVTSAPR